MATLEARFLACLEKKDDAAAIAVLRSGPFLVNGWPPVMIAAGKKRDVVVLAALDALDAAERKKQVVLAAGFAATASLLRALLARGLDPNARHGSTDTPLLSVYAVNQPEAMIAELLAAGADPNARGPQNKTALHVAAYHARPKAVAVLLAAPGIDVDAENEHKSTALAIAMGNEIDRRLEVIRLLLAAGAAVTPHAVWLANHYSMKQAPAMLAAAAKKPAAKKPAAKKPAAKKPAAKKPAATPKK